MNYEDNMIYSNRYYNNSIFGNKLTNTVKKIFNISHGTLSSNRYQFNEVSIFYQELLRLSKQLGLGGNISIDTLYEGKIPEKVFTIYSDVRLEKEDKYSLSESIHDSMKQFCDSENINDFFKNAYILIK